MTTVDQVVASIGLPRHPNLDGMMEDHDAAGRAISLHMTQAQSLATQLSATGYPSSTLGDGGSRGTDDTSSTERAAGVATDHPRVEKYRGIDQNLATALRAKNLADRHLTDLLLDITHHAQDLDPVPVGTGECQACGRFCRPTKSRPGFRLRSGLCPSCYGAYSTAGRPEPRSDWIRARRNKLTDASGVVHPEELGEMDLSSENL